MRGWLGYVRVSRVGDRAETLISPAVQSERIEAYAAAKGLTVQMLEPELDVSGGKVERPILGAAIEAIERREAAGIIVAQLDRLSRMDVVDALLTIRRIEAVGGKVIAVAEDFDSTPEGEMGRNVFLAMGQMQLDRYKQQFRTAKARAVERGIWPISSVPFGYEKGNDRRLVPNKDAGRVVRGFELRATGASWHQIAAEIDRGISGTGKMVKNRVYLGEIHYGEWVNLEAHPPIVGRDLWEAAQIHHPAPPRGEPEPALLAGLVRCAGCGYRMSVDPSSGTTGIYKCRPRKAKGLCPTPAIVSMRRVEQAVEVTVLGHLKAVEASAVPKTDVLALAVAELEGAEVELSLYQQATKLADVGAEHFAEGMRQRTQAVEAARRGLARARLAAPALPRLDSGDLTREQLRHALRGSLGVIWVWKGNPARFRVIAAGFEPGEFGPVDWVDADLPGEIGLLGA